MGRAIVAVAVVFMTAVAALQHADLIGSFGEPLVLLVMGTLFILLSKAVGPAHVDGTGLGATVLSHPTATAA